MCSGCAQEPAGTEGEEEARTLTQLRFFPPCCCLFRHYERDVSGEAVHQQNDREQRARHEGAAHGQGDGETGCLSVSCKHVDRRPTFTQ